MENVYRCASAGSVDIIKPPNGTIIYHTDTCHWCYIQGGTDRPPIKEKNESVDTFKTFSGMEDLKLKEKTVSRE